jgi:hypothetical protein
VVRSVAVRARRGRSAGVLVPEQGRERKGGWSVGHPEGRGPAGGGEGGYDRLA